MTYDFDCDKCEKTYELLMTFSEFDDFRNEDFQCPVCKEKGIITKMKQVFKATYVKIFLLGSGYTRNSI